MNTFYIIRHGETYNNRFGKLSGWIDSPLMENGLEPTKSVIAKLQSIDVELMFSSDLGRAFITAYVVARGIDYVDEIVRLPGLREVNYGDLANHDRKEAYAQYPGLDRDTNLVPPNGESLAMMQKRVFDTVNQLDEANENQNILLVCHSGVIAALHSMHIGRDFGEHNISEAYDHDYLGKFTMVSGGVGSFQAI